MDYREFRKNVNRGWNTWSTSSMLTYAHLPDGFAIKLTVKDFSDPRMLRDVLIGRQEHACEVVTPGPRTYDGSYTELTVDYAKTKLKIRTAAVGDEQYVLVSPSSDAIQTPVLAVESCLLWGREGSVGKDGNGLYGKTPERDYRVYVSSPSVALSHTYSASPYVAVTLDREIAIATVPCTVDSVRAVVDEAKAKLDAVVASHGKQAEAYAAMTTCLAWDTIYDAEHDRICSTVSRLWNISWGGYVLFDWDTYFASLMASYDNRDLAYANAIAITDEITEMGFIPNFGAANGTKSRDRSQPPVGSFACLEIYERWGGEWFLSHVFDNLLTWNRWFFENRRVGQGCLAWGSHPFKPYNGTYWEYGGVLNLKAAEYESGLDNSPMYDGVPYNEKTHVMELADVGLMSLYVLDCECLEKIASILGKTDVLGEIASRREAVDTALQTLWSDDVGMFLNRRTDTGERSERLSPTNFYALMSDRVTKEQAERMLAHFYDPREFAGEYMIPSISRNDPAYPDQDYWRGRIWAPMNYLVYIALRRQGLTEACDFLAEKSEALILKEWREHGHVHENYNGDTGEGCDVRYSDRFYHWGGLLSLIGLENERRKA